MKKVIFSLFLLLISAKCFSFDKRSWGYFGVSPSIGESVRWNTIFGVRNYVDSGKIYMGELFFGPSFKGKEFRFSPMYYHNSFWIDGKHYYTHNIATILYFYYRYSETLKFFLRIFGHNTFYASIYSSVDERWGYSLLTTWMVGVRYNIFKYYWLSFDNEVFYGLIEDSETITYPVGFLNKGFQRLKTYIGIERMISSLFVRIQFVIENVFKDSNFEATNVYAYLTAIWFF